MAGCDWGGECGDDGRDGWDEGGGTDDELDDDHGLPGEHYSPWVEEAYAGWGFDGDDVFG